MAANTAQRVEKLITPVITEMGYSVWDVRFVKEGASYYLRVFIDKDGLIDINDCTDVSHAIDPVLDEADIIGPSYYLEVCSPGIERELTRPSHFEKYIGRQVCVHLIRAQGGAKDFCGALCGYDGGVSIKAGEKQLYFQKDQISFVKLNDDINLQEGN